MKYRAEPIHIGSEVSIDSPGHRQNGKIGKVIYHSEYLGTVGVTFDGDDYGFAPFEVIPVEPAR